MDTVDLELERNEASDLAPVTSEDLLARNGWDVAYFIFLDEGTLDEAVGLLGHRESEEITEGWEYRPVAADCGPDAGKTDDSEAAASYAGYTYVVASHYGKKAGPLQVTRQWMARFRQEDAMNGGLRVEVKRDKFKLHRLVNDALAESAHELIGPDKRMQKAFIERARRGGEKKGKKWARRLRDGDYAFNIEGASFRPNGNLLVGLRFPVTASGAPLAVELAGVPDWFDGGDFPTAVAVWALDGPGSPDELVGFRAMSHRGDDEYDCVLGNLDAVDKGSLLIECYPQGAGAVSQHWRFRLDDGSQRRLAPAELVKELEGGEQRVEGIAPGPDGRTLYVVDEDGRVGMRFLRVG